MSKKLFPYAIQLVGAWALLLSACEARQVDGPASASAAADGGLQGRAEAGGSYLAGDAQITNKSGDLPRPTSGGGPCVIAIRVDICCAQPVAATATQVNSDPCLVLYPSQGFPGACSRRPDCSTVKCKPPVLTSRLMQATPGGGCAFTSECSSSSQCTVATDVRVCCACPEAYPRKMVSNNLCLVPYGDGPRAGPPCPNPNGCARVCAACFGPSVYPMPSCKASPVDPQLKTCQIQPLST